MYTHPSASPTLLQRVVRSARSLQAKRGLIFGAIIVLALLAFELFNYTTTDFALTDLLGDIRFAGVRWAAILAVAFCGMDFAGVARLFTPERSQGQKTEVWYLLGAWILAAAMNALLTWWGVSLALLNHANLGNEILSRDVLLGVVPVFVAALVVLIRVLIIGTFTMAGNRLFSQPEIGPAVRAEARPQPAPAPRPAPAPKPVTPAPPPDDINWDDGFTTHPPVVAEPRRMAPPPRVVGRPMPTTPPFRPAPKPAPKPGLGEASYEVNGHNQSETR